MGCSSCSSHPALRTIPSATSGCTPCADHPHRLSQTSPLCVLDSADLTWEWQMLFNRGLIDYSWPSVPTPTASQSSLYFCPFWRADGLTDGHWCREGEITSLDTHVEPRSLFEAQLRNRRQGQGTAGGGAPRL